MSTLNLIREAVNNAQNDRFSYDLDTYLEHLDKLVDLFDISILTDKEIVIEYYEGILEMLEGIKDSFNENNIPEALKDKVLFVILSNWNNLISNQFLKEKQLDDTLINIMSMLHLKKTFLETDLQALLNKYNPHIPVEDYEEIKKRAWTT